MQRFTQFGTIDMVMTADPGLAADRIKCNRYDPACDCPACIDETTERQAHRQSGLHADDCHIVQCQGCPAPFTCTCGAWA